MTRWCGKKFFTSDLSGLDKPSSLQKLTHSSNVKLSVKPSVNFTVLRGSQELFFTLELKVVLCSCNPRDHIIVI